jgi:hypothetical protein
MIIKDHADIDNQELELRMIVAGYNANGEADLFFCKVRCTRREYNDGEHYARAGNAAVQEGYGGHLVTFDEHDTAGRNMLTLFAWDTATTYVI